MILERYFLNMEQSMKAKEIGFNEPCLLYWDNKENLKYHNPPHFYKNNVFYSAPLYEQFLDWYSTNNVHTEISRTHSGWFWRIHTPEKETISNGTFDSKLDAYRDATCHLLSFAMVT